MIDWWFEFFASNFYFSKWLLFVLWCGSQNGTILEVLVYILSVIITRSLKSVRGIFDRIFIYLRIFCLFFLVVSSAAFI